jgi:peptidoglycan hydrolase CwlO-like protein
MKNTYFSLALISLSLLISLVGFSQSNTSQESPVDQSLKGQFQDMVDKAESYTEYKVIKRTVLNQFERAVQDSLSANRTEINSLKNQVQDQKSQIDQLSKRIGDLETQLAESESLRESLSFLGLNLNKTTYHLIVWVMIIGLAGFGLFAYTSFVRSNIITTKTKKEYATLELEFDEHKKSSHEKQIKIARELQTERNTVEELKSKLKAKNQSK